MIKEPAMPATTILVCSFDPAAQITGHYAGGGELTKQPNPVRSFSRAARYPDGLSAMIAAHRLAKRLPGTAWHPVTLAG